MHVISALLSGVRGAENGRAEIYERGTSTRASYYSDFGGTVHASSGGDLALDAYGGAEVYVNRYVDVFVYDDDGTLVRDWTDGKTANSVEYKGPAFTGTDYDTAQQATGKPISVEAVLNLWQSQNSAADWQVKIGSTTQTLPLWLGALSELVYNVKDPAYGALGDGSADDTSAISAAISAAATAGGGIVFFPEGTYRITSAISVLASVNLWGMGPNETEIQIDHATAGCLAWTGNTPEGAYIRGLKLTAAQVNTGTILAISGTGEKLLEGCYLGGANNDCPQMISDSASEQWVTIRGCVFEQGAASQQMIVPDAHTGRWLVEGCRFDLAATVSHSTSAVIYGNRVNVVGCRFQTSNCTSGTAKLFHASSTTVLGSVRGCVVEDSGGATVVAITLGTYVAASRFVESGNVFPGQADTNFTAYSYTATAAEHLADVRLFTREQRTQYISSNDTAVTVDADQYGAAVVARSGTANCTVSVTNNAPVGANFRLLTQGPTGSTPTFDYDQVVESGTLALSGLGSHVMSSARHDSIHLVSSYNGTVLRWGTLGSPLENIA